MKSSSIMLILLIYPAVCLSESTEPMALCDVMATLSARAVQAKDQGANFVEFMDKVETLEYPSEVKALLKFFVADAFVNGITPEHAYTKTFKECMLSKNSK